MSALHQVRVAPSELREMESNGAGEVTIDTDERRAYLRIGDTVYVADLTEPTC